MTNVVNFQAVDNLKVMDLKYYQAVCTSFTYIVLVKGVFSPVPPIVGISSPLNLQYHVVNLTVTSLNIQRSKISRTKIRYSFD